ncbi:enterobactin exporter EntS [mine drainage metagenome]|uniref:Enterobactin exporter EntS n=1 Tax=mine drainage metagenome TaxID=410659 RepID=A0A1J5SHW2_9ZZZZ
MTAAARAALGYRDFRLFLALRFCANIAQLIQIVAVGWQVYDLTRRPQDLGYVGLVLFLPQILLALVSGAVADHFDRRRIAMLCLGLEALSSAMLLALSWRGLTAVAPVYLALTLFGVARSFLGPALQSVVPLLVRREDFPNAVAWNSTVWQMAVIGGPALGGFLYALGPVAVYGLTTLLLLGSALAALLLRTSLKTRGADDAMIDRLTAGIRFILARPVILGAISLDLFAVLFGGATALLPIFARDILHVGPWGLGLLRSAPAVGAALCGLLLAHRPLRRRAGLVLLLCVAGFGLATILFGLSRSMPLSLAALAALGGFDMISVYVRQNLVQLSTPDAMRGRVSAVSMVFVGASNELGEFESGMTAAWFGTVPAVLLGGLGTLAVVALWTWRFKALRRADRLDEAG